MKRHAILFGLNYDRVHFDKFAFGGDYTIYTKCRPEVFEGLQPLHGSINDVRRVREMLLDAKWHFDDIRTFTDETCGNIACPKAYCSNQTTRKGILEELQALAKRSFDESLEVAWIHFSGHSVPVYDESFDEVTWYDECIVPSDFSTCGLILDDEIHDILATFNSRTSVICVFDCNHSGTICDLKYRYVPSTVSSADCGRSISGGDYVPQVDHRHDPCPSRVVLIGSRAETMNRRETPLITSSVATASGPEQTTGTKGGVLTTALLKAVKQVGNDPGAMNVHGLMKKMRAIMGANKNSVQVPELSCSRILSKDETLF